jgi:hypothetical protein
MHRGSGAFARRRLISGSRFEFGVDLGLQE